MVGAGAEWIQIDEPTLVQDRTAAELALFKTAYADLSKVSGRPKLMLQTYFESLDGNWETVAGLPVEGIGLDFVRTSENLMLLNRHGFPSNKVLGAGVVNGRNVWRINLEETLSLLEEIAGRADSDQHLGAVLLLAAPPALRRRARERAGRRDQALAGFCRAAAELRSRRWLVA